MHHQSGWRASLRVPHSSEFTDAVQNNVAPPNVSEGSANEKDLITTNYRGKQQMRKSTTAVGKVFTSSIRTRISPTLSERPLLSKMLNKSHVIREDPVPLEHNVQEEIRITGSYVDKEGAVVSPSHNQLPGAILEAVVIRKENITETGPY